MMTLLREALSWNYVLVTAVISSLLAQFTKVILNLIILGKFIPERLWGAGGMPSAHSALVCSMFMAAAKSMDRNGSQLIRDFMRQTVERQHNTWFRDQVEAGRQQLERGDVLPHDMVESSAAAWRDEMSRKVAGK